MRQTAIYTAPKPKTPFRLTPRMEEILAALYRYEYLNQQHVQRLYFGPNTRSYGYPLMKALVAEQYAYAATWHKPQAGKGEHEYHVDTKGVDWLRRHGYLQKGRLRRDKLPESNQFWDHLVSLNHVLISFELWARAFPTVSIEQFVHDFDFQRRRHQVRVTDGTTKTVAPDGLLIFAISEQGSIERRAVLVEADRNTEFSRQDWLAKCDRLTAFITQIMPQAYGLTDVDVAVTTPNEHRREVLRHWTYEAMTRIKPPDVATQFFFTSEDPTQRSAVDFVSGRHWHYFTDAEPLPLMALPGKEEPA
jgi:hypothetical protein